MFFQQKNEARQEIDAFDDEDKTALMRAVQAQNLEETRRLIDSGADLSLQSATHYKRDALMFAAINGSTTIIEHLLEKNSQLAEALDESGNSALMLAIQFRQLTAAKMLLPYSNLRHRNYAAQNLTDCINACSLTEEEKNNFLESVKQRLTKKKFLSMK